MLERMFAGPHTKHADITDCGRLVQKGFTVVGAGYPTNLCRTIVTSAKAKCARAPAVNGKAFMHYHVVAACVAKAPETKCPPYVNVLLLKVRNARLPFSFDRQGTIKRALWTVILLFV